MFNDGSRGQRAHNHGSGVDVDQRRSGPQRGSHIAFQFVPLQYDDEYAYRLYARREWAKHEWYHRRHAQSAVPDVSSGYDAIRDDCLTRSNVDGARVPERTRGYERTGAAPRPHAAHRVSGGAPRRK